MAESNKGVFIDFGLDIGQFRSALSEITKQLRQLQKQLTEVDKQLKFDPTNTDLLKQRLRVLQSQVTELVEEEKRFAKSIEDQKNEMEKNGKATEQEKANLLTLEVQLSKTRVQIENYTNEIEDTKHALEDGEFAHQKFAKGVKDASDATDVFNVALGNLISSGIRAAINGIKKLSSAVYDIGIAYDEVIADLRSIYADDITELELQSIIDKTKELGSQTEYTAAEVASGLKAMALAGYSASESVDSVKAALDLASASGEDLNVVSEILVNGLNAFGYGTDQASRFANVLGVTAIQTTADVGTLGESFKYVGSVAGAFNFEVEDVATTLGIMAQAGVNGSMAGTALRQTLSRLATNTKDARTKLEGYTGSIIDSKGNMMSLDVIMGKLRKSLKGLNDTEKADILKAIGGERALSALNAIIEASEEDWNKLSVAVSNSKGVIEQTAAIRLDSLYGDVEKLEGTMNNVAIAIMDKINPKLRETVQDITALAKSEDFNDVIDSLADTGVKAITAIGNGVKFIAKNLKPLKATLAGIASLALVSQIGTFASKITALAGVLKGLTLGKFVADVNGLGIALKGLAAANPVITALAATVGAVAVAGSLAYQRVPQQLRELNSAIQESVKVRENAFAQLNNVNNSVAAENLLYEKMTSNLEELVTKNGELDESEKERAQSIVNTLIGQGLLPEETKLNDVIKKWDEYKKTIEDSMLFRQASAVYEEALNTQKTLIEEQTEAQKRYNDVVVQGKPMIQELANNMDSLAEAYYAAKAETYSSVDDARTYLDSLGTAKLLEELHSVNAIKDESYEAAQGYLKAIQDLDAIGVQMDAIDKLFADFTNANYADVIRNDYLDSTKFLSDTIAEQEAKVEEALKKLEQLKKLDDGSDPYLKGTISETEAKLTGMLQSMQYTDEQIAQILESGVFEKHGTDAIDQMAGAEIDEMEIKKPVIQQHVDGIVKLFQVEDQMYSIGYQNGKNWLAGLEAAISQSPYADSFSTINQIASSLTRSGGFGSDLNYRSGGHGGINLNATFNVSANNISKATVESWADMLTDRINENLGGLY